jgi:hypothetical protein
MIAEVLRYFIGVLDSQVKDWLPVEYHGVSQCWEIVALTALICPLTPCRYRCSCYLGNRSHISIVLPTTG